METTQNEVKSNETKAEKLAVVDRMIDRLIWLKDGRVLRDMGDGPKPWKVVKRDMDPQTAFRLWSEKRSQWLNEHPAFAEFQQFMVDNISLKDRAMVLTALTLLADNPDRLWADLGDAGVEISICNAVALCKLYTRFECEKGHPQKNQECLD